MSDDVLVRVDNVSKRFCRSLKRSLWYGLQDLGSELGGRRHGGGSGLPQSSADVTLRPDEFWAVKDVSFELRRGECLGLIGRNGAGKTTLLRMLNGLIKPDTGRIEMRGRIGALIALGAGFNPLLTGRENIKVNGSVLGLSDTDIASRIDDIIDFSEIEDFIDSPVQMYSSGMQVRLGFAIATSMKPDILILDEVLAVGDAAFRSKCFNRITSTIDHCAVIFVSHSMSQVGRISTSVALMKNGLLNDFKNNSSKGIAAYNDSNDEGLDRCNTGSDLVDIIRVKSLKRGVHDVKKEIKANKFTLSVEIDVKTPIEEVLELYIVIIGAEMQNVAELKRPIQRDISQNRGMHTIQTDIDESRFNNGKYYASVSILHGNKRLLAANCQYACSFLIETEWIGYAPIRL